MIFRQRVHLLRVSLPQLSKPRPPERGPNQVVVVMGSGSHRPRRIGCPRSVWTMQPATSPRRPTALYNAVTASRDFIRESIEYPTIRPENTSLTAQI